jgi:hypothetical protein
VLVLALVLEVEVVRPGPRLGLRDIIRVHNRWGSLVEVGDRGKDKDKDKVIHLSILDRGTVHHGGELSFPRYPGVSRASGPADYLMITVIESRVGCVIAVFNLCICLHDLFCCAQ